MLLLSDVLCVLLVSEMSAEFWFIEIKRIKTAEAKNQTHQHLQSRELKLKYDVC